MNSKIEVTVRIKGDHPTFAAGAEINNVFERAFKPIDVCDDPLVAYVTNAETTSSMQEIIKLREDAAKEIAEKITKILITHMSKHDAHNGY